MAFLVLHDADGQLAGVRFAGAVPCSIGRGSENALVVHDEFVDHRHAEVVRRDDGMLLVRDLGSVNGVRRPGDAAPVAELELELREDAPVQVGRSVLRLMADAPVRARPLPAITARPIEGTAPRWLQWARRRPVQIGLPLVLVGWAGAAEAVRANSLRPALDGAYVVVGGLLLLGLWAAGWALGTRLRIGEGRFGTHLAAGTMASGLLVGLDWLAGWADFLQPQGWVTLTLGVVAIVATWWLALHLHLRVIRPEGDGRLPALTAGLALVFSACTLGLPALAEGFSTDAEFTATLKATPAALIPVTDAGRYAADLTALQRTLDADTDTLTTVSELTRPLTPDSAAAPAADEPATPSP